MSIKLLFFLTHNASLLDWKNYKILSREITLYQKYAEQGNKVKIISYGNKEDINLIKDRNIEVIPIFEKTKKQRILKYILGFFYFLKNYKKFKDIDIIKTNQVIGSHLAILLKILIKKKLIIRMGYEPYLQLKKYEKNKYKIFLLKLYCYFSYKFADKIIITTEELKKQIMNFYGVNEEKITVIPNLIDTNKFKDLEISSDDDFFTITRFDKQKNLKFLFDQFSDLDKNLFVYGNINSSNFSRDCCFLKNKRIKFMGSIENDDLPKIINKHKFFILLSHIEGNPKSLLEAMSCERIVIGSMVDGIKNIIEDKKNGFLFDLKKDNLKEFISKINKFDLQSIKVKARDYVRKRHHVDIIFKKEIGLIRNILNETNI